LRVLEEGGLKKPLVMRVAGTAEEEAKALLAGSGVRMFPSSTEAASAIVNEVSK
jgi:succinyl-CoA synthetase beta subunit